MLAQGEPYTQTGLGSGRERESEQRSLPRSGERKPLGVSLKPIERSFRVLFTQRPLIASLTRALAERRPDERLKVCTAAATSGYAARRISRESL